MIKREKYSPAVDRMTILNKNKKQTIKQLP